MTCWKCGGLLVMRRICPRCGALNTSGVPVPAKDVLPPKCAGCETRCSGCPMSHPDSTVGVQKDGGTSQ